MLHACCYTCFLSLLEWPTKIQMAWISKKNEFFTIFPQILQKICKICKQKFPKNLIFCNFFPNLSTKSVQKNHHREAEKIVKVPQKFNFLQFFPEFFKKSAINCQKSPQNCLLLTFSKCIESTDHSWIYQNAQVCIGEIIWPNNQFAQ